MKTSIQHPELGTIVYEESFWSGKKTLHLNGSLLTKITKNSFSDPLAQDGQMYILTGSYISGVTLTAKGHSITLVKKPAWYEIALAVLWTTVLMVWGNSPALCAIFPIFGGAIGGGIAGGAAIVNLVLMKKQKTIIKKIAVSFGVMIATMLVNAILAILLFGMLI